jgi:DNA-binding transcriptional MocR family regulator
VEADPSDTDAAGSSPPYRHIADVLRGEITDGRYRVGERIPSQAELEERFHVSRPTVQRALGELRKDGFIDNQRGRAAEVLPWRDRFDRFGGDSPADQAAPGPSYTLLPAHLAEAFEHKDVRIDAFCLTTETLNSAMAEPIRRAMRGELRPDSLSLRVLLPKLDAHLAIPRMVSGDPRDDRPLQRLRQRITAHAVALRNQLESLRALRPQLAATIELRTVPITPMQKVYILNGRTALFGYYSVVKREVDFPGGEKDEIYDVLGMTARLFPYRADPADPEAPASRFVIETRAWFDALWTSIAQPEPLDPYT